MEELTITQDSIPTKGIGRLNYCLLAIIPLVILLIITFIILFIALELFSASESLIGTIALIVVGFYSLYFLFISYKRIQNIGKSPFWLILLLGFPYLTIITLLALVFIKGKYKDVISATDNKPIESEPITSDETTDKDSLNNQSSNDIKDNSIANMSVEEVFAKLKK